MHLETPNEKRAKPTSSAEKGGACTQGAATERRTRPAAENSNSGKQKKRAYLKGSDGRYAADRGSEGVEKKEGRRRRRRRRRIRAPPLNLTECPRRLGGLACPDVSGARRRGAGWPASGVVTRRPRLTPAEKSTSDLLPLLEMHALPCSGSNALPDITAERRVPPSAGPP